MDKGQRVTQTSIASRLQIKQGSVSEWNQPDKYPTLENAVAIAKLANVCVEWLYTERGPKRPPPTDPNLSKIYDKWETIPDIVKGRILQLVEEHAMTTPETLSRGGRSGRPHADGDITPA